MAMATGSRRQETVRRYGSMHNRIPIIRPPCSETEAWTKTDRRLYRLPILKDFLGHLNAHGDSDGASARYLELECADCSIVCFAYLLVCLLHVSAVPPVSLKSTWKA